MKDLVLRLVQFCDQYNINQKDTAALPIKSLILSLKYIDKKALFLTLYPEEFADFDLAERAANTLGDAETWLCLLSLFDWPHLTEKHKPDIETNHKPLAIIKHTLKAHNLDAPGWGTACKVLILQMIQGLQSMHAIELLTSRMLGKSTHDSTMKMLAALCDTKHLPEDYLKTLGYILSPACMTVNEQVLGQTLSAIQSKRDDHKMNLRLKNIQMVALRPRLRDRLKISLLAEHHKEQVDSKMGTWDSYTGYCHAHRFPNTLSDRIKRQLYFLAAQTRWDWTPFVQRLIESREIEDKVKQLPVLQADIEVLNWVIENLGMDGRPPCKEMMAFKARCFASFPIVHVQQMTLTQVLRLYVSAYQAPNVWKDIWKAQIGILSPQIIRDCEVFVDANAFAGEYVAGTLCGGALNRK
jgi:hypothetical protein